MEICLRSNPKLTVKRAHFSALTPEELNAAMSNLDAPNRNLAAAVQVRQEADLRVGAALTRYQTIRF